MDTLMKRYVMMAALLLVTVMTSAIPAKRGQWSMITLADGTQVKAELCGDEHLHFMQDAAGNKYVADESGAYHIADMEALVANANTRRAKAVSRRKAKMRKANNNGGYHGTKKGIIILVEYTDVKFTTTNPQATFNDIANKEGYSEGNFKGSVRDYFAAQSNGDFILDFDVVGPVQLEHNQAYYGANDYRDDDMHPGEMIIEACKGVDSQVNFADYDWDGDGYVDQVYVIYAGKGENDGGGADTVWPHAWDLYSATSSILKLDGMGIYTYACGSELNGSGNTCGIGTLCHEFSHCLGFPDFYDTRTNGNNFGMDSWDLMDYGSYNGGGYRPAGYTSYEKWWAGWLTPTELNVEAVDVTNMKPLANNGEAYVLYNDSRRDDGIEGEYYLLENRQKTGWDASLAGKGLLVLHVDYDENAWSSNVVNNTADHQRCTIFHADNTASHSNCATDAYPYGSNNGLTNTSTPKASLYNKNTDDSYLMNKPVTEIIQNADGTVSFKYLGSINPSGGDTGTTFFYESFDQCNGFGGNDGSWVFSSMSGTFKPDNDGWSDAHRKNYAGDKCAIFGTAGFAGAAITPAITINGSANLGFKAAAWGSDTYDGTTLTLSVSSGTITPSTFTLKRGEWTTYKASITATGDVKVTLAMDKGRFFLDEVTARTQTSDIRGVRMAERPVDNRIYGIDGRYLGTNLSLLRPGIYIVNGKKVVR